MNCLSSFQPVQDNSVLKTATFKEFLNAKSFVQSFQLYYFQNLKSPNQNSYKQFAQFLNTFKNQETPNIQKEDIIKWDLFINQDAVNFSQVQLEIFNEERVLFFQDQKVEYWFLIIEGSISHTNNELQEYISYFDYSKVKEEADLSFTFYKNRTQSPPQNNSIQSPTRKQFRFI